MSAKNVTEYYQSVFDIFVAGYYVWSWVIWPTYGWNKCIW